MLIWLDQDDPALGDDSRKLADEALREAVLAVSAITFWEIAMLVAKQRIAFHMTLERWRLDLMGAGLVELPLDGGIGLAAAQLDDLHGDPADRFILATAQANGAVLLTADQRLLDWPGKLRRHDARV